MRQITASMCVLSLAVAVGACSDDDGAVTDGSSGTTASSTTEGPSSSSSSSGSTTAPETGSESTTSSPDDSTGTGSGTDSGGTSSGTTASDTSTSTGEESSSGNACVPIADGGAIGQDCGPGGAMCPPEYTCQGFEGFVFTQSCQIICTEDCECPAGLTCNLTMDKSGVDWFQCGP